LNLLALSQCFQEAFTRSTQLSFSEVEDRDVTTIWQVFDNLLANQFTAMKQSVAITSNHSKSSSITCIDVDDRIFLAFKLQA
jgi:hypothetical protein